MALDADLANAATGSEPIRGRGPRYRAICCGRRSRLRRAREIEKAGDQRVEAVHFRGNVAGQLARERLGVSATFCASISAEPLMTPSGLRISCARPADSWPSAARRSERRASASARRNWRLVSSSVSEELVIARDLAAVFDDEAVHQYGGEKKEEDADRQDRRRLRRDSYSCRAPESETNSRRARRARSTASVADRAEINRGGDDGQIVNRIVGAVDADFAGVVEEQCGENEF